LGLLFGQITNNSAPQALGFAPAIAEARYRILEQTSRELKLSPMQAAFTSMEWTLPVLYNRIDLINVQSAAPPAPELTALAPKLTALAERLYLEEQLEKRKQQGIPDNDPTIQQIRERVSQLSASIDGKVPR
jgi:hypothetical protein